MNTALKSLKKKEFPITNQKKPQKKGSFPLKLRIPQLIDGGLNNKKEKKNKTQKLILINTNFLLEAKVIKDLLSSL